MKKNGKENILYKYSELILKIEYIIEYYATHKKKNISAIKTEQYNKLSSNIYRNIKYILKKYNLIEEEKYIKILNKVEKAIVSDLELTKYNKR